jgi:hypothetical protein
MDWLRNGAASVFPYLRSSQYVAVRHESYWLRM